MATKYIVDNIVEQFINGGLSATTLSGGTLYGDGSNLTNLPSEWTEVEVDITDTNAIKSCGTVPIEILPAPGVGKYYEYEGVAEYTYNTTSYDFNDLVGILGESSYSGVYILPSNILFIGDRIMQFNSKMPIYIDTLRTDTVFQQPATTNERIVLTTWGANDATIGDGTFKIKLKYKVIDFG